jgi:hypothetical protein
VLLLFYVLSCRKGDVGRLGMYRDAMLVEDFIQGVCCLWRYEGIGRCLGVLYLYEVKDAFVSFA